MPSLATSLLQGLKDHGAREIFGILGDFVLPFFKVIEESGILPHYTLSHEPPRWLRSRRCGTLSL
jgi:indolepyruvate decarboxylase